MTSIDVRDLTKEYGTRRAVDHSPSDVRPGKVTGFLGPNGAGKSTTMRLVLGLDRPTSGTATIGGRPYAALDRAAAPRGRPARRAGRARLPYRPRPSARPRGEQPHPGRRVDAVLEETGLASVARRRVKTYSLGMRQRLGIAGALLGDPEVVLLDEPSNGLDPEGIVWIRELLRRLAARAARSWSPAT
jgi:ABC-2 type transport system ATP-binding protein